MAAINNNLIQIGNFAMSSDTSVRRALAWSFSERYIGLVISLGSSILLARLLNPRDLGIYSLCATVTTLATIVRDFGTSEYLIQEKEITRIKIRSAFTLTILIAWSIAGIILLAKNRLADYYAEPALAQVLGILSINFLLLPIASPAFALMNRKMDFKKIFVVQSTSNFVLALTSITLALQGQTYLSLAWGSVAGIVTQVILVSYLYPRDTWILPSTQSIGQIIKFGGAITITRLIETAARNGHELIIGKQFGFAQLGLFNRGNGLIELLSTTFSSAILRVATPALAAEARAGRDLIEPFSKATAIFTGICLPFVGFVAMMSADIIHVLFGDKWSSAAPLATALAVASLPYFFVALVPNALTATGQVGRRLSVALWISPIQLLGVLIASFFSLFAVTIVFGVVNIIQAILYIGHAKKALGGTYFALFARSTNSIAVLALYSLIMAIGLLILNQYNLPPYLRLTSAIVFSIPTWLTCVSLLKHPALQELQQILRKLRE